MIYRHAFGFFGELAAILFLTLKFYSILEPRCKTRYGEIDIVAKKGNTIVFIEVKARKFLNANYTLISHTQKTRIRRAALHYMQRNKLQDKWAMRFDIISISKNYGLEHYKNVDM